MAAILGQVPRRFCYYHGAKMAVRHRILFHDPDGEEIPSSSQRFDLLNDFGCVAWILELRVPLRLVSCCSQLFNSVPVPQ